MLSNTLNLITLNDLNIDLVNHEEFSNLLPLIPRPTPRPQTRSSRLMYTRSVENRCDALPGRSPRRRRSPDPRSRRTRRGSCRSWRGVLRRPRGAPRRPSRSACARRGPSGRPERRPVRRSRGTGGHSPPPVCGERESLDQKATEHRVNPPLRCLTCRAWPCGGAAGSRWRSWPAWAGAPPASRGGPGPARGRPGRRPPPPWPRGARGGDSTPLSGRRSAAKEGERWSVCLPQMGLCGVRPSRLKPLLAYISASVGLLANIEARRRKEETFRKCAKSDELGWCRYEFIFLNGHLRKLTRVWSWRPLLKRSN